MKLKTVTLALLLAQACSAESFGRKLWRVSVAAVATSSIADVSTSWGKHELNPMLRGTDGRFGARGIAVKGLFVGSLFGVQRLMQHRVRNPEKVNTFLNFAYSGVVGVTAIHNTSVPR